MSAIDELANILATKSLELANRYREQCKSILVNNGKCPSNTMCSECIVGMEGAVSDCNSEYTIKMAKGFLKIEGCEQERGGL
jgi:hypothetical protein